VSGVRIAPLGPRQTRALMGDDFWPYGVEPNRATLEALVRYSCEQGLAERRLEVEELFAPSTLDEFRVCGPTVDELCFLPHGDARTSRQLSAISRQPVGAPTC
jgi:hypothetical protein